MSDYQAQTVTECLGTWCTLTAGHDGDHTDLREPRTAREELARIIRDGVGAWRTPLEAADAILKALAPREVTTEAELDALGFQAVVLDPCGTPAVCQRSTQTESFWELGGIGASDLIDSDTLMLSGSSCTVLHDGDVSHRDAVLEVAE